MCLYSVLAVLCVRHRPGGGGRGGVRQNSALRGSDNGRMGLDRRLCVSECRCGGAGV